MRLKYGNLVLAAAPDSITTGHDITKLIEVLENVNTNALIESSGLK